MNDPSKISFDRLRGYQPGTCEFKTCHASPRWRVTDAAGKTWILCEGHKLAAEAALSAWIEGR